MKIQPIHYIVFALAIVAGVYYFFINPSDYSILPQCPSYKYTGTYCPGCGSQRAIHSLLHGDFAGMMAYNPMFLPVGMLLFWHWGILLTNRIKNTRYLSPMYHSRFPYIVLVIVLLYWLLRNIPYYPFSWLAPG